MVDPSNWISRFIVAWLESVIRSTKVLFGLCIWQTWPTPMVRNLWHHTSTSQSIAVALCRIGSKKPQLSRGNLCMLVCNSSPLCFVCLCWSGVNPEDNNERTLGHRLSPIMLCGDTWNNVHVERFIVPICYVDANILGTQCIKTIVNYCHGTGLGILNR